MTNGECHYLCKQDEKQNSFTITSTAIVKVTSLPFEMESQINLREIKTIELKVNRLVAETIFQATPWWVPVVSAFGAVIVLAALVALLRKVRFNTPIPSSKAPHSYFAPTVRLFQAQSTTDARGRQRPRRRPGEPGRTAGRRSEPGTGDRLVSSPFKPLHTSSPLSYKHKLFNMI